MNPSERRFEAELEIEAPREAVWKALAEGGEVQRWFAPEASVEGGVGGEMLWRWGETHAWPLVIEAWEPGQLLRARYASPVEGGAGERLPLFVEFRLRGEGGRTTLRLVHSGFGPGAVFDQEYDGISRGWPVELRSLRLYVERHAGRERRVAWSTHDVGLDPDEAWQLLTGPRGLGCGPEIADLREGEAFRIEAVDGAEALEGVALVCGPRELSAVATSHGDGFLRVCVENCGGNQQAWLWLATWREPAERTAALQARWDVLLERLFGAHGAVVGAEAR